MARRKFEHARDTCRVDFVEGILARLELAKM